MSTHRAEIDDLTAQVRAAGGTVIHICDREGRVGWIAYQLPGQSGVLNSPLGFAEEMRDWLHERRWAAQRDSRLYDVWHLVTIAGVARWGISDRHPWRARGLATALRLQQQMEYGQGVAARVMYSDQGEV